MRLPRNTTSLTRRLIDYYFMFGLACIFVCISLAIYLALRGIFLESMAIAAAVPIFLLLLGSFCLRRTVRLHSAIEDQLRHMNSLSGVEGSGLRPIAEPGAAAMGWNAILEQLDQQKAMNSLADKLSASFGSAQSRRLESVFNRLTDGIAVVNATGRIEVTNSALVSTLGKQSESEVVGTQIDTLLAALGSCDTDLLQGVSTSVASSYAYELRRGAQIIDGVWRVNRLALLEDGPGACSAVWTIRDITQQKLAEDMRNQFVFTATHELRTPLANIKAYAETLASVDDLDLANQQGFINTINSEATRLARFVDELLDISQMEAGAISVTKNETDMERLLSELIDKAQPQILQKHQQFEDKMPAKVPKLSVDKDKLVGALTNLLGNAVKYTPEGGQIRFLVEIDDVQIHFHVEDSGIGVAADELPRITEKFFRSQDARVQQVTGSGLGLAFAQEVARLHGGRISIRSEINKGSRFTLSLPLPSEQASCLV